MSKYTPGPWTVYIQKTGGDWCYQIHTKAPHNPAGGLGEHVATSNASLEARGEHNARLIASTPDLLQVCQETLEFVEGHPDRTPGWHETRLQLRTKLLKVFNEIGNTNAQP